MALTERRREKFLNVARKRQVGLTVVMENIHDPHNVSAVLRSCDAVGVLQVELLYTVEKFPRIGKKSSSSASKWIQRRLHRSVDDCYRALRAEGFRICATHLTGDAVGLYDLDLTGKIALVFGNEHRGVSEEAAAKADVNFHIPMVGMIQSLNVSVAVAVSLYEAYRQRNTAGMYDRPTLSEETLVSLVGTWHAR